MSKPTAIQQRCIPAILNGRSVIAASATGTGKTAAFALPIIQELSRDPYGIFALIITPTRELAIQMADQFRGLGAHMKLTDCLAVGGFDHIQQQTQLAKRPHIVIATPGRLADHIRGSSPPQLKRLRFVVYDEFDRLFAGQFDPELQTIRNAMNNDDKQRQTLLFTATAQPLTPQLTRELALSDALTVSLVPSGGEVVALLDQKYVIVPQHVKEVYLVHVLTSQAFTDAPTIVFTSKCDTAKRLAIMLALLPPSLAVSVTPLHSKLSQPQRTASLNMFRGAVRRVLVCTDVASRGLDIPTASLVINYDIPADRTLYIHRVGRTARAGRGGLALSFVSQYDIALFKSIEALIEHEMSSFQVDEKQVVSIMKKVMLARREANLVVADEVIEQTVSGRAPMKKRSFTAVDDDDNAPTTLVTKEEKRRKLVTTKSKNKR